MTTTLTSLSESQIQPRLNRLHQLLQSDVFDQSRPNDGACELAFIEIISLLDDVLLQVDRVGKRVDFYDEVGVHGKLQDITSLVASMHQNLSETKTSSPIHGNNARFNCYFGAGTGYFANNVFFSADYDNEVAFFVDDDRIYLNRHIKRALQLAEQRLVSTPITSAPNL